MENNDLISRSALIAKYDRVHVALTDMAVLMEISAVFKKSLNSFRLVQIVANTSRKKISI